jgi:hypothetical protein
VSGWRAGSKRCAPGAPPTNAIGGSRLEILDTGHVVFSSDPDGFLAVVEPFLQLVSLRR